MKELKNIALVAHDNRKKDLIEWVEWNYVYRNDREIVEEAIKRSFDFPAAGRIPDRPGAEGWPPGASLAPGNNNLTLGDYRLCFRAPHKAKGDQRWHWHGFQHSACWLP